ncbi:uncharacterized protein LOC119027621 isoform X2 [Acanthopagrus latus]|uniref:uncharacterized protein LOC119027621 isoform X2 n=1 Tax=Acanthopagrus latus TaxID=8177 RepID=UPI00187D0095|nr:uncharacterized protein LOC119027621 isoform X2 [Acanthopagrus latus]
MEKMICRILLLISLNCVCGTFVVNVTQTSYQAEENHNITLEWTFTPTADTSPDSLVIFCEMRTDHTVLVLFLLHGGVVVPESQDQQFVGRVQLDKDALSDGRLRLHMSRLRTEDSGWYLCDVRTNYGVDSGECRLNVSAARDWPEPERPNTDTPERPNSERANRVSWGMIFLCGLGLTAAVALCGVFFAFVHVFIHMSCLRNRVQWRQFYS